MRAVFAHLRTQVFGKYPGVHMSVNAARKSACATGLHHLWWAAGPWKLSYGRGSVTLTQTEDLPHSLKLTRYSN